MRRRSKVNQARHALIKTEIMLGDVQAVRRGRIAERLTNRALGRLVNKLMRGLWR